MIFRVNARVLNRGEWKEVFFVGETDHETLADLHHDIVRDGCIHMTRYDTRGPNEFEVKQIRKDRRLRFVTDAYEVILHKDGFTSISEPMEDIIDTDGEPIFLIDGGDDV